MPVTIDDLVEAAANGVLRALDARDAGQRTRKSSANVAALVGSGFFVDCHIRCGVIDPNAPQPPRYTTTETPVRTLTSEEKET